MFKHGDKVKFRGAENIYSNTMIVDQILTCQDTGFQYAKTIIVGSGGITMGHLPVKSLELCKEKEN